MSSPCPSAELFLKLVSGSDRLSPATVEQLENHLLSCNLCHEYVQQLERQASAEFSFLISYDPDVKSAPMQLKDPCHCDRSQIPGETDAEDDFVLPFNVGCYSVEQLIGRGGMGEVYSAQHMILKRDVAIKFIRRNLAGRTGRIDVFQREIEACGRLKHPNIVTVYDAGQYNGVPFLVMELLEGLTVSDRIRINGVMTVEAACEVILQAAAGLENIHRNGMTHRDVKPANLWMDNDGLVKVLDLGLAVFQADASSQNSILQDAVVPLECAGTPDYIAPEQCLRGDVGPQADIYALGCTFFYILTGHPPFSGQKYVSQRDKLTAHLLKRLPRLQSYCKNVPTRLQVILDKMTASMPEQRYESMKEVRADLQKFLVSRNSTSYLLITLVVLAALLGLICLGNTNETGSILENMTVVDVTTGNEPYSGVTASKPVAEPESDAGPNAELPIQQETVSDSSLPPMLIPREEFSDPIQIERQSSLDRAINGDTTGSAAETSVEPPSQEEKVDPPQEYLRYLYENACMYERNDGDFEHYQQSAYELFVNSAGRGFVPAQIKAGLCCLTGFGTKVQPFEALKWFQTAAEKKSPEGLYLLGCLYDQGLGTVRDRKKAFDLITESACLSWVDAQLHLAAACSSGDFVEKDLTVADRWLRQAAQQNSPEACYWLGYNYEQGIGVTCDESAARSWFFQSAKLGQVNGQLKVAQLLFAQLQYDQAFGWFQKAAEQGCIPAVFLLGKCYLSGLGVNRNDVKGFELLFQAAEAGHPDAMCELGKCYQEGKGVSSDQNRASFWIRRAADSRSDEAAKIIKKPELLFCRPELPEPLYDLTSGVDLKKKKLPENIFDTGFSSGNTAK